MTTNIIPVSGSVLLNRKAQVEKLFPAVQWESASKGFIECPGYSSHNTLCGDRDCAVFIDRVPTIMCFHQSCADDIEAANKTLRKAIRDAEADTDTAGETKKYTMSAEQKAWIEEKRRQDALRLRAASALPRIIKDQAWTLEQAHAESPVIIPASPLEHWQLFLNLFKPDDIIWVGSTYDSGAPHHASHFIPVSQWRQFPQAPHQFTCPSTFKVGTYSRSNDNVLVRRYLVIESDTLKKEEILAVFQWLRKSLQLRAIVDTAGKSLHGWFEYPNEQMLAELKIMLPAMGCDPALFKPSQPCRVPGCWRENKIQSLVWLDGGAE